MSSLTLSQPFHNPSTTPPPEPPSPTSTSDPATTLSHLAVSLRRTLWITSLLIHHLSTLDPQGVYTANDHITLADLLRGLLASLKQNIILCISASSQLSYPSTPGRDSDEDIETITARQLSTHSHLQDIRRELQNWHRRVETVVLSEQFENFQLHVGRMDFCQSGEVGTGPVLVGVLRAVMEGVEGVWRGLK